MATQFKNALKTNIGTTAEELLPTISDVTILGFNICNTTANMIKVNVWLNDNTNIFYYLKDVVIPASQSLKAVNGGEKLIISSNTRLWISADTDVSADVVLSYIQLV